MPAWLSAATSAITALNRWFFRVTVWMMAIVVPVMLYEVVARYVFNAPTVWGMELAVLVFGPYFLFGGPYLLHLKGHVTLDIARQRMSARWQHRMDLLNYPVIIVFCGILLYFSVPSAWSSWNYARPASRPGTRPSGPSRPPCRWPWR
jgi:TRAP-type mannitol/chloroaromatic compound transport system permease small subunit